MTTSLTFHQIYPKQKMPVKAQSYSHNTVKRAELFCHPFKQARDAGSYFFSPIAFEFKLTDEHLLLRTLRDDGNYKEVAIDKAKAPSNNHFLLLQDTSPTESERCLDIYRHAMRDQDVPDFIDRDSFGFYEVMVNAFVEEEPHDFFLQIWLGGVVETPEGVSVLVKHPSNTQMDPGFLCLDATIDTHQWRGWLAVVIKPQRKNEWVSISTDQPICQIVGANTLIDDLHCVPYKKVDLDTFMEPIRWHIFDPSYGRKAGKYQREIRNKQGSNV